MENKLKSLRTEQGKTQMDVAMSCRVHPARYSAIERGKPCVKSTARRIASALDVKPEEAFPKYSNLRGW